MDFQNVNFMNARFNLLSGNLFPMTNRNSFSLFWKIYSVLTWVSQAAMLIVGLPRYIYTLIGTFMEEELSNFGIAIDALILMLQTLFISIRIYTHKDVMYQIIEKLNDMLNITDEIMKNIVPSTLAQVKILLNFYWYSNIVATWIWGFLIFLLAFEKDQFSNADYGIAVSFIFSKEPFSRTTFLIGWLILHIISIYMVLKKVCVDVYVVNLLLMVTAQYKYIALKFATICQEEKSNEFGKKNSQEANQSKEKEIRALCRHHKNVLCTTSLLKIILSLNFTLTFLTSIFRFSFIGILLSSIPSVNIFEALWVIMYAVGVGVQLYILCSSVQQLLDASTEITDQAFHESWYLLKPSVKRIFLLTILANNLDSKVSSIDKFNLSLPSFMTILNQAYSITLLVLKMKQ